MYLTISYLLAIESTPPQGLTEEFKSLKELDLKNSSLTHIKLFPKLPALTKLDLSENRLSKGLEVNSNSF
jgi:acidic leucine-rich nuclear phosphoprotein 32 family protein A/C/D